MWRFPILADFLRREGLALAVDTADALSDGSYWHAPESIYDDRDFMPVHDPVCDFGGGD
jgi:hypothetical protein